MPKLFVENKAGSKWVLATVLLLLLSGCGDLKSIFNSESPDEKKARLAQEKGYQVDLTDNIEPPGYFDVGMGFGVIQREGPDVKGVLLSFRGYPYGRWYTRKRPLDSASITNLTADASKICPEDNQKEACENKRELDRANLTDKVNDLYRKSGEYREISSRDRWWHRISFFYALSPEKFTGGNLDTNVDAIGIGIDFTPQLSLILGGGNYENTGGGISNDYIFGVSLNLNAFSLLNGK